jgi:murein DD-endopeptidase MepM/ murein hydrolase activator NlpD
VGLPVISQAQEPVFTPTPYAPRQLPMPRTETEQYTVQANDTLFSIARQFQISLASLILANDIANPDLLEVGQVLVIPPQELGSMGSGLKLIPDSELIYGPSSIDFDIAGFIASQNGFLASYVEEVDQQTLTGAQIIERVAREFSVNPRLLLAVLEMRSGWVTQPQPAAETIDFPIAILESWRKGLYLQLAYAANNLNRGYYLWRAGAVGYWVLADDQIAPINPQINAGTAGVQHFYSLLLARSDWDLAISEQGLFKIYQALFGNPFNFAVDPVVPADLTQPVLQLPFEREQTWLFTGGPHGGWGDGSAWAALDFAPPGEPLGCVQSDTSVVAVANGTILRAENGAVIQDLDISDSQPSDGYEQTGWVVLYMHIEGRERVSPGTYLQAGERIGHPSCEGGISTGTHVHLARRYNGEWIPADGHLPFILDGWISQGTGNAYDGFLRNGDQWVEAWEGNVAQNQIRR